MRKTLLLSLALLPAIPALAQQTELIGRAGLGLMRFGGPDAAPNSLVLYNNRNGTESGYTNSPYGSRLGAGVALGGRVQRVGKHQGLLAFDLGYDWVRSRVRVVELYYSPAVYSSYVGNYAADGSTALQTQNIAAFLGGGRRFALASLRVDVLAGPELAAVFGLRETGSGTYDGGKAWATNVPNRGRSRVDARLRADATVWHQRLGVNASYSYGLINYQNGLSGASPEVYSRTWRLGVAYRLK